jgi:hypothetical protein
VIGRSGAFVATTPNRVVRDLNPEFNAIRLETIMESFQRVAPDGNTILVDLEVMLLREAQDFFCITK